ncbi:hypothetical protein MGH68_19045 [Erysipelothrix sp. D19-032]
MPIMTIIGAVLSVIIGFQMKDVASGLELTTFGSIFLGVSMLVIYAMIIASVVLTYKAIIDMLYKGIYKKSAYRLFTYPASSTEIFIAKTITKILPEPRLICGNLCHLLWSNQYFLH